MEFITQVMENMKYGTYYELERKGSNRKEWTAAANQPTEEIKDSLCGVCTFC